MTFQYKNYRAEVFYDSDDEIYVGHVLSIPKYIGFHGITLDEAQQNFEYDVDEYENKKNLE